MKASPLLLTVGSAMITSTSLPAQAPTEISTSTPQNASPTNAGRAITITAECAPLARSLPAASLAPAPPLALPAFRASTFPVLPVLPARQLAANPANPAANAWSARKAITSTTQLMHACAALSLAALPAKETLLLPLYSADNAIPSTISTTLTLFAFLALPTTPNACAVPTHQPAWNVKWAITWMLCFNARLARAIASFALILRSALFAAKDFTRVQAAAIPVWRVGPTVWTATTLAPAATAQREPSLMAVLATVAFHHA